MKRDEGFTYKIGQGRPYPPGISKEGDRVNICVEAEGGQPCSMLLYVPGEKEACHYLEFEEEDRFGNLCFAAVEGLPIEDYEYTFLVGEEEVCDPYAKRVCGREKFGEIPPYVHARYKTGTYDWEGDLRPRVPYEDGILYTAHVRGMTMDASSKVHKRGTFAGIRERIPYLKKLGINMLELMPAYEFEELMPRKVSSMAYFMNSDRKEDHYRMNYWGYGSGSYFAPKASYAAGDDPEQEFKDMVKALHQAGVEVILEFYFPDHTSPGLIVECLKHWVLEYHVDGFHLNGYGLPFTWIAKEPLLSDVKLMAGDIHPEEIYGDAEPYVRNLAEYNDGSLVDMRRFLKGEENQVGVFAHRVKKNPSRCGVINYIASHNGYTLSDMVSYEEKHNEANGEDNRDGNDCNFSCNYGEEGKSRKKKINDIRRRQRKNALLMVFLSQGTPCIAAGDECGNSQNGNNNAYCLDSPVSWVNYGGGKAGEDLREFLISLIAFRKAHPVFHQSEELRGMDYHACGYPDISYHGKNVWYPQMDGNSRQLGIMYSGDYAKDGYFYVAYNMHPEEKEFALPNLPGGMKWYRKIDTSDAEGSGFYAEDETALLEDQKNMCLAGRTIAVLHGR